MVIKSERERKDGNYTASRGPLGVGVTDRTVVYDGRNMTVRSGVKKAKQPGV